MAGFFLDARLRFIKLASQLPAARSIELLKVTARECCM